MHNNLFTEVTMEVVERKDNLLATFEEKEKGYKLMLSSALDAGMTEEMAYILANALAYHLAYYFEASDITMRLIRNEMMEHFDEGIKTAKKAERGEL